MASKVYLVTGATSGIGRVLVEKLAHKYPKDLFLALGRRSDRLDELSAKAKNIKGLVFDLARSDERRSLQEKLLQDHGGIDVLVNNAGVGYKSSFFHLEEDKLYQMFQVNVMALTLLSGFALAETNPRRVSHIVNVSSMAGHRLPGVGGFYAATKFAVRALSESMRREIAVRKLPVRITQVSPAATETEFLDHYLGDRQKLADTIGEALPLRADDVADAIIYALAAPANVDINDVLIRPLNQRD